MAAKTDIEWTGATWTPIRARNRATGKVGWFCVHHSAGCINCYAEDRNRWIGNGLHFTAPNLAKVELFLDEGMLRAPLAWKKPRDIFVCSMTDLFASFMEHEWIDRTMAMTALAPQHTYQVLTKRSDLMRAYFAGIPEAPNEAAARAALIEGSAQAIYAADHPGEDPSLWLAVHTPLPNVWLGVSVEEKRHKNRIDDLRAIPAAVRFLSLEPLLEDLGELDLRGIHWIIVGGESGRNARPIHPDWVRAIQRQCEAAGVAFFFKQWGEWGLENVTGKAEAHAIANDGTLYRMSDLAYDGGARRGEAIRADHDKAHLHTVYRVGKDKAGAKLDGREWRDRPLRRAA